MLQILANLDFRKKLAVPLVLLALLLLIVGGMGIRGVQDLQDSSDDLANVHMPAAILLLDADRDMYQAFLAERSLLLTSDAQIQQDIRSEHEENLQQVSERVAAAAKLEPEPKLATLFVEYMDLFNQWRSTSSEVIRLGASDPQMARDLTMGRSYEQFSASREALDQLSELIGQLATAEGEHATSVADAEVLKLTVSIVIGVLFCALLIVLFPLSITRPLQSMLERIRDIAEGEGDLTARVGVHGKDELGQVSVALNLFLDRLQSLIREVRDTTTEVVGSADKLKIMATDSSEVISLEHAAVDQVSTAAAQMSAAIHEVAHSAQQASDTARNAEALSRDSAQVVGENIQTMRDLSAEVEHASEVISTLQLETNNIGDVLAVIKGIAEQTNLLALNAAIEAARAGDQGRGFAVVADEVRALAGRTQESTKDIEEMIDRLQSGAQNAVRVMQSGSNQARSSVERASVIEGTLAQAASEVGSINEMAAHIATACEEQSCVTEEITRNITEIRDLSDRSAGAAEQNAQASKHLSDMAGKLGLLVGRFRV